MHWYLPRGGGDRLCAEEEAAAAAGGGGGTGGGRDRELRFWRRRAVSFVVLREGRGEGGGAGQLPIPRCAQGPSLRCAARRGGVPALRGTAGRSPSRDSRRRQRLIPRCAQGPSRPPLAALCSRTEPRDSTAGVPHIRTCEQGGSCSAPAVRQLLGAAAAAAAAAADAT